MFHELTTRQKVAEEDAASLPTSGSGDCARPLHVALKAQGAARLCAHRLRVYRPEQVAAYKSAHGLKPALIIRLFPHIKMLSKNIVSQDSCQQEGS